MIIIYNKSNSSNGEKEGQSHPPIRIVYNNNNNEEEWRAEIY